MGSIEDLTSLLLTLLIILGLIAGCTPTATPLSPTVTPAPSPPPEFVDVAELATRPDVAAIVIGTVVRDLGEEKGPVRDMYHRWEVAVGQFVVGQGPERIVVRVTKAVRLSEGPPIPTKEPRFDVGEEVLLFLSKTNVEGEISLESNEFTILGPLSGKYIIENGLAHAASWADAPSIPIDELVARIKMPRHSE